MKHSLGFAFENRGDDSPEAIATTDFDWSAVAGDLQAADGLNAASEYVNALLWWMLTGAKREGTERTRAYLAKRGVHNPREVGLRFLVVAYKLRPEMLRVKSLSCIARAAGVSPQTLHKRVEDFDERFPALNLLRKRDKAEREGS